VLTLPRPLLDQVIDHARRDHPDECCGVITGRGGVAVRVIEMENAERSPTGFSFDSAEWLRVYREVDDADEELLVVYHSHTATEAYPSRTDVLWAQHNEFAHWLLVSTRAEDDEVRSYTIAGGVVTEEPVQVL
jgi:[CysO sulfur-carrier protein]-S-L-cysteine hydrolase